MRRASTGARLPVREMRGKMEVTDVFDSGALQDCVHIRCHIFGSHENATLSLKVRSSQKIPTTLENQQSELPAHTLTVLLLGGCKGEARSADEGWLFSSAPG